MSCIDTLIQFYVTLPVKFDLAVKYISEQTLV